ncbi:MAG TPA: cytochrome P450 [Acidimicrobiales bacterium]|jgi:cytochrome P450 family 142 subfamily A polypeptide 1|nr:cytochrome P450 [Acidimicrobiales bacterium]
MSTTKPTDLDIGLTDGAFYGGNPFPAYAWMREHAPAYFDEVGGVWGISRYADVKEISKDPDTFSNAGGIRPDSDALPMMIDTDAPEHVRRRRLVSEGFTPGRIRESEPGIRAVCDSIIDKVCEQGSADFVRDIAAPLPMVVIGDMLGVAPEDRDDLLRWSDDMLKALGSPDPGLMDAATLAAIEYAGYATAVMDDRRQTGRSDDLIGTLVHAEIDGDHLDDQSLIYESLLILIGGDETTRHVITGGMYELLRHPDQLEALRADRSLMTTAVEEMLRWVTPIKNMARTMTKDVELHGETLHQGQKLLLLYPSANRDERIFDEPDTFDITRTPNDHVAFGFGAHFCLGNRLARMEMRIMFDRLLDRLPDLALVDEAEPPMREANFVSGYETMPVTFTPSAPLGAGA